ncbi:MAG: non-homologous end-joining DNA ligase [Candidatus Sumerlaeaceae bacterium]
MSTASRAASQASPSRGASTRTPGKSRSKTAKTTAILKLGRRSLPVSRVEKVYYPQAGFTKGQVLDYYVKIGSALLPHLKDRPLTLKRYPEGVTGEFFYEKRCPFYRPDWVKTAPVWSEGTNSTIDFCLANDLPTLIWAANLGTLELHTSLSKANDVLRPTLLAFDLDPGPPADIVQCCQVGLWLREMFGSLGLDCFPKTSGSKGLQVYVPLNTPGVTYDHTKGLARAIAQLMEREHPTLITSVMKKSLRSNKVFIDWSQNDDHKTTVCVYSLRARETPTVSTPVTWHEVEAALKAGDPNRLRFTAPEVVKRFDKHGDLFEPVLKMKQKLPRDLLANLRAI